MRENYTIATNIVNQETYRKVTMATLEALSDILEMSFGPTGSNSAIHDDGNLNRYSKDGRTILDKIRFNGIIEETVRQEIREITRAVDLKVGDGTTSSIILARGIYKRLLEYDTDGSIRNPYECIRELKEVSEIIGNKILENKKEFNADTAYDISYISTNGDEFLSKTIKDIYEEYGNDVFIEVLRSNDENTKVKILDGLLLEDGYYDPAFINRPNNKCELSNPRIYTFTNNIDTPDMADLLKTIIYKNIFEPISSQAPERGPIPTVIIAPYISRDMSPYIEKLIMQINAQDLDAKVPLLMITSNKELERLGDISALCGCKAIQKYIDPEAYKKDVELGLAATVETVTEFYGTTELISCDSESTKFVNPKYMWEEYGVKHTSVYDGLVNYIKNEIKTAEIENHSIVTKAKLKKRLHSLMANMVELYIGGISSTDRDYYKDLAIDAVKNVRSAARTGVGYGANVEAFLATRELLLSEDEDLKKYEKFLTIIFSAYNDLLLRLYENSSDYTYEYAQSIVATIVENEKPVNIVSGEVDERVVCSIETDIEILASVIKIISILYTSNQFIAKSTAIASSYNGEDDYITL